MPSSASPIPKVKNVPKGLKGCRQSVRQNVNSRSVESKFEKTVNPFRCLRGTFDSRPRAEVLAYVHDTRDTFTQVSVTRRMAISSSIFFSNDTIVLTLCCSPQRPKLITAQRDKAFRPLPSMPFKMFISTFPTNHSRGDDV